MASNYWDRAFDNMGNIDNSSELPLYWSDRAAQYRTEAIDKNRVLDIDVSYGAHEREVFDLVWPDSTPEGLLVFVHGGYWIKLDKSYWTDFAEGARANGWAVCIPSYTLAPEARIGDITRQVSKAICKVSELVMGPIRLSGHSAGGHLVTRMLCDDGVLPTNVLQRVKHAVSISGLHDLRPLLFTEMNKLLRLDNAEAAAESPVLHNTTVSASITVWVGGNERPEFIRQAKLLKMMWEGLGADITCKVDAMHNHFTVIEGLKKPDSDIVKEILIAS